MRVIFVTICLLFVTISHSIVQAQSADKITMRLRVVCNNGPGGTLIIAVDIKKFAGGSYIGGYGVDFRYTASKMIFNSTNFRYVTQYWSSILDDFDYSNSNLDRVVQQKAPGPGNALPLTSQYFDSTANCNGVKLKDGYWEILYFVLTINGNAQGTADFSFLNFLSYKSGGGTTGSFESFIWNQTIDDNYNDTKIELKNITVPVELVAFNAIPLPDGKVRLTWRTVTETNNLGFEIQRLNGELWEKVGFVNGHGNSTTENEYSYIDAPKDNQIGDAILNDGTINYRLKQVDLDGTQSYSNIAAADLLPTQIALGQSYPNPMQLNGEIFNSDILIPYQLAVESNVNLAVYNSLGQKVADLITNQHQAAGYYTSKWDGKTTNGIQLQPGIYFYGFSAALNNGEMVSSTKRLVLMK